MRTKLALPLVFASLALTACSDGDFPSPETVEKDRVLAGRVVIAEDATRVTPMAGEGATYELLVGGPGVQASWSYLLGVCRLARDVDGAPYCDPAQPLVGQSGAEPSMATPPDAYPAVAFAVPAAADLREGEDELLLQGIVCPGGPIDPKLLAAVAAGDYGALAAGRNPCADKSRNGVLLAAPIPFERSEQDRNHAPTIQNITWTHLAHKTDKDDKDDKGENVKLGAPWTSQATALAGRENCKDLGYLEVQAKQTIAFQFELDPDAKEHYLDPSPVPGEAPRPRVEIPSVQGLSSAGHFDLVRDNQLDEGQLLQLEWSLSAKRPPPQGGLLVRFWFLATDDRYGDTQATSWETRALCVLP